MLPFLAMAMPMYGKEPARMTMPALRCAVTGARTGPRRYRVAIFSSSSLAIMSSAEVAGRTAVSIAAILPALSM